VGKHETIVCKIDALNLMFCVTLEKRIFSEREKKMGRMKILQEKDSLYACPSTE
jgi:hypothetical protein